jgi:hypothetical protein
MKYNIREFKDNLVVVDYEDGSWAEVPVFDGMSPQDVDKIVESFKPKPIVVGNSLLDLVGTTRNVSIATSAVESPEEKDARLLEQDRLFKEDVSDILKSYNLI